MGLGNIIKAIITADNKQFNEKIKQVEGKLEQLGSKMQDIGKKMSMYVTAPLTAIGVGAFKAQKDFEASMSKITGLVGVAAEQVNQWSDELIRLGPELGKSPKELADALFFVTSAGLRGAEAMDVLKMSAKASVAGLGETKTVADLVTSAMNAYGSATLSATEATDVLVATVREGKGEASDYASAMGQILPVSSSMKIGFNQVGAAMAAMTRTGTNASQAATQLTQIMMGLQKPSEMANKAFIHMKTSAAELRRQIREEGLLATLVTLKDLTNEYGEEMMANVFPNIRAFKGVLDLMGEQMGENIAIQERMNDTTGDTEKAFKAAAETSEFAYQQALSQISSTLVVLGDAIKMKLLPIMTDVTEALKKATAWFMGLSDEVRGNIVRWAGLAAAIGPVLVVVGTFMKMLPILRAGLISLRTAALGPLGIAIAAVYGTWKLWNTQILRTTKFTKSLADKGLADLESQAESTRKELRALIDAEGDFSNKGVISRSLEVAFPTISGAIDTKRKAELLKQLEILDDQIKTLQEAEDINSSINSELDDQTGELQAIIDGLTQTVDVVDDIAEAFTGTVPDGWAEWFEEVGTGAFSVKEHLKATEDAINALWKPSAVFKEIDESVKALDETFEKLADPEKFETPINYLQMLGWAAEDFGNAVMRAGVNGSKSLKEFAAAVKATAKQNIAAFIAEAVAATVAKALASVPFPFNIALAATAGGLAAGLFNAIPAFAQGGAVSGPTLAMVGEGAGVSRSNPEYIGTADQLSKMGGGGMLTARVSRGDLLFILNEGDVHANRTF